MKIRALLIALLALALASPLAMAGKNDEKIAALEAEIAQLKEQIASLEKQCGDSLSQEAARHRDEAFARVERQSQGPDQNAAKPQANQQLEQEAAQRPAGNLRFRRPARRRSREDQDGRVQQEVRLDQERRSEHGHCRASSPIFGQPAPEQTTESSSGSRAKTRST